MFLNGTAIEIINEKIERGRFRFVLFDFDGTISLIREGWQQVMIPLMVEILAACPKAEPLPQLQRFVEDYVAQSTGIQTIYQMIRLAEEVARRGGRPEEPQTYKRLYNDRLLTRIRGRLEDLASGRAKREEWMVFNAEALLDRLSRLGCTLYCFSGTDDPDVKREAALLGVAGYFTGGIYGAIEAYENFSKKMLIAQIIRDNRLHGAELLTLGDGFVEIEDTKAADGVAVGVASDERTRSGVDPQKRERLIRAGADLIVPDYRELDALMTYLFPGQ